MDKKIIFEQRRGQIAIWVVVGILIVVGIVFAFIFSGNRGVPDAGITRGINDVESFMQRCTSEFIEGTADSMLPQGGFARPRNSANFDGLEIEYLCENVGFYEPCIQQHPGLLREMEREIADTAKEKIEDCMVDMKSEFESRGATVKYVDGIPEVQVRLREDNIKITYQEKTSVTIEDVERVFDSVEFGVKHPAYNLASIALEIAGQEASFCYFEYVGYSILYPRYEIRLYTKSDSTRIYKIKDKQSDKEMNIAIRGCALAGGLPAAI